MVFLTLVGLINSGIAVFYYLRLLAALYSRLNENNVALRDLPCVQAPLLIALVLTVAATLMLGIVPGRVLDAARAAAITLQIDNPIAPATVNTAKR